MPKAIVSVIRTQPSTVISDCHELMVSAGIKNALDSQAVTILKDNISWHFPFLGANTTPWQLEGTIKCLQSTGFKNLVAVHNNTVVTNPYKGEKLNKLDAVFRSYGIAEKYNFDLTQIRWNVYQPKTRMHVLNRIYPDGIEIPEFFFGKNIVHLPTMKTHIYTTTTGAMKNAFGGLLNTRRHYTHSWIHETLVDLLAIQREIHSGIFAVMDGTICGSGPGPRTMIPVEKGYLLASADQVAIDGVAAKMMGFDPMSIPYLRMAHDDQLGIADVREIEVVGENISSVNFHFSVGDNLASSAGNIIWFGPLGFLQRFFFHTPLVFLFVFASYFYHDFFWWPFKGKKIMQDLRKKSMWANFFDNYTVKL